MTVDRRVWPGSGELEMAHLIAMTFDSETEAASALMSLRELEKSADLDLEDSAVLVRDRNGEIKTHNELSGATEKGLVAGGMLGAVLGFAFPIAGVILGAAGGALVARVLRSGVDPGFARELGAKLQPGSSALVLIVRQGTPELVLSALHPHKGHVFQTTLSPELEQQLRHALQE
jgi:uncharacterized membrane protein